MKIIGWREWAAFPELGIPAVKAKVDTGARTSAIHCFLVVPFTRNGQDWVHFGVHPVQRREDVSVFCEAPVKEQRDVTDSGGHTEQRYVIESLLRLGKYEWPIELTLTNRDTMRFRMLLGRQALREQQLIVQSHTSYLLGDLEEGDIYDLPSTPIA